MIVLRSSGLRGGGRESFSGCTDCETSRSYLHCVADMWRIFMSVPGCKQVAVDCTTLWRWAAEDNVFVHGLERKYAAYACTALQTDAKRSSVWTYM